ncbi:MAG: nucleotidyltransferase domain-containing protein [Bacillota bacterium]
MSRPVDLGEVRTIHSLLRAFTRPWYFAGGWALDLYLGKETRPHEDVEIVVFRCDQSALRGYLVDWSFQKAIPGEKRLELWREGELLGPSIHEVHCTDGEHELEILFEEGDGACWRYRRNPAIGLPVLSIGLATAEGFPYLAPELILLYKAKNPRDKDEADLASVLPFLDERRRGWLRDAVAACYPGHPWPALITSRGSQID